MRNKQVYDEALTCEVRDFTYRLDKIQDTASINGQYVDVFTKSTDIVTFNETTLGCELDINRQSDDILYTCTMATTRAIGGLSSDQLLVVGGEEYVEDRKEVEAMIAEQFLGGYESSDQELYLKHETKIMISRSRSRLKATKSSGFDVLDEGWDMINFHLAFHESTNGSSIGNDVDIDAIDLEILMDYAVPIMDREGLEQSLCDVTTADLVLCMKALRDVGIANKRMKAYRNAPADIDRLNLLYVSGDFR